jgi:hypothetical protein
MAIYVNVTLKNSSLGQHVFSATDDVLGQNVLSNTPLQPDESVSLQLVADEYGYGQMTYGYRGGVPSRRTDIKNNEEIDVD